MYATITDRPGPGLGATTTGRALLDHLREGIVVLPPRLEVEFGPLAQQDQVVTLPPRSRSVRRGHLPFPELCTARRLPRRAATRTVPGLDPARDVRAPRARESRSDRRRVDPREGPAWPWQWPARRRLRGRPAGAVASGPLDPELHRGQDCGEPSRPTRMLCNMRPPLDAVDGGGVEPDKTSADHGNHGRARLPRRAGLRTEVSGCRARVSKTSPGRLESRRQGVTP